MPSFTSMIKPLKYLSSLFLLLLVCSCRNTNPDFSSIRWTKAAEPDGIQFYISKKGNGEKARLHFQYLGWLDNNKFIQETPTNNTAYLDSMVRMAATEPGSLPMLEKGSEGYIKFNPEDYLQDMYSKTSHFVLFYSAYMSSEDLRKDSLALGGMKFFKTIKVTSALQAAEEFSKNYPDIKWQDYLDSNPLPASVTLTVRKDLYQAGKMDSIKKLLEKQFPNTELSESLYEPKQLLIPGKKKNLIFRFTVW